MILGAQNDDDTHTNCDMTDNDPQFWSEWGSPKSSESHDSWEDGTWDGVCVINPAVAFDFAMATPPQSPKSQACVAEISFSHSVSSDSI